MEQSYKKRPPCATANSPPGLPEYGENYFINLFDFLISRQRKTKSHPNGQESDLAIRCHCPYMLDILSFLLCLKFTFNQIQECQIPCICIVNNCIEIQNITYRWNLYTRLPIYSNIIRIYKNIPFRI